MHFGDRWDDEFFRLDSLPLFLFQELLKQFVDFKERVALKLGALFVLFGTDVLLKVWVVFVADLAVGVVWVWDRLRDLGVYPGFAVAVVLNVPLLLFLVFNFALLFDPLELVGKKPFLCRTDHRTKPIGCLSQIKFKNIEFRLKRFQC